MYMYGTHRQDNTQGYKKIQQRTFRGRGDDKLLNQPNKTNGRHRRR